MATATKVKKSKSEPKKTAQKCTCGCGGWTKGGKFLPGHDSRLKGTLQQAFRSDKGPNLKQKELVKELGWSHLMKGPTANGQKIRAKVKPASKFAKRPKPVDLSEAAPTVEE